METAESKKLALLRIVTILEKNTDKSHGMTQAEIGKELEKEYGIVLERKAIARNLDLLKEADLHIEDADDKGVYFDGRVFDDTELRLLIDSVRFSRYISAKHAKELIEKICGLSNKFFSTASLKHVQPLEKDASRTENKELFHNIDVIGYAIDQKKVISFDCWRLKADLKEHKESCEKVLPLQMILSGNEYYLLVVDPRELKMPMQKNPDRFVLYRIDMIRRIRVVDKEEISQDAIDQIMHSMTSEDMERLVRENPVIGRFFYHEKVDATLVLSDVMNRNMWQSLVDYFGKDNIKRVTRFPSMEQTEIEQTGWADRLYFNFLYETPYKVKINGDSDAIFNFLMENRSQAFLLEPEDLRKKYEERIKDMMLAQKNGFRDWKEQEMDEDDPLEIKVEDYKEEE